MSLEGKVGKGVGVCISLRSSTYSFHRTADTSVCHPKLSPWLSCLLDLLDPRASLKCNNTFNNTNKRPPMITAEWVIFPPTPPTHVQNALRPWSNFAEGKGFPVRGFFTKMMFKDSFSLWLTWFDILSSSSQPPNKENVCTAFSEQGGNCE